MKKKPCPHYGSELRLARFGKLRAFYHLLDGVRRARCLDWRRCAAVPRKERNDGESA